MTPADRANITNKTLAKYRGRPFELGSCDCLRLARSHLVAMGHKMPKIPAYKTPLAAMRRLRAQGVETVGDLLAQHLKEIPPAYIRPGDIAIAPSDDSFGAVLVAAGNGKFLGWAPEAEGLQVLILKPERAFNV